MEYLDVEGTTDRFAASYIHGISVCYVRLHNMLVCMFVCACACEPCKRVSEYVPACCASVCVRSFGLVGTIAPEMQQMFYCVIYVGF